MTDHSEGGQAPTASPQEHPLLAVAEAVVRHREPGALLRDLAGRLRPVVRFASLCLRLHDAASDTLRLHAWEAQADLPAPCAEVAVGDHPAGWVWQTQQPLVVSDLAGETRWP